MTAEQSERWGTRQPDCDRCRSVLPDYTIGRLPDPARRDIERHLAGCAACRAELAFWLAVSEAEQRAPVPAPPHTLAQAQDRLLTAIAGVRHSERTLTAPPFHEGRNQPMRVDGRRIEAGAETQPVQTYRAPQQAGRRQRREVRGPSVALRAVVAALVIIALSAALFGYLALQRQTRTASHKQHVTPTLTWQGATLPDGYYPGSNPVETLVPAPSDGNVAYACGAQADHATEVSDIIPLVWVTQNRGQQWTQRPSPVSSVFANCQIIVDGGDSQSVMLLVNPTTAYHGSLEYLSRNGGKTWQARDDIISQLVTLQGEIYALRSTVDHPGYSLYVSKDDMASWTLAAVAIQAAGQHVEHFWLDVTDNLLLAETALYPSPDVGFPGELWGSHDGGHTWSLLRSTPAIYEARGAAICGLDSDAATHILLTLTRVTCSTDGGQTWKTYYPRKTATIAIPTQLVEVIGASADESLLILASLNGQTGIVQYTPGDTQWRILNQTPQLPSEFTYWFTYAPPYLDNPGVIWAIPLGLDGSTPPSQRAHALFTTEDD